MNTTIQALQVLYVKLGGSLTDTYSTIANGEAVGNYTTIPDMIEACAQKAESGGGGGGSSSVEVLELTISGNTVSTVKTASEIEALYETGKIIYAVTNIGAYAQIAFGLFMTPEQTSDGYILYGYTKGDSESLMAVTFEASSADSVMSATISG